jgi:uncharacterized membrane protein (UPF0127 family)
MKSKINLISTYSLLGVLIIMLFSLAGAVYKHNETAKTNVAKNAHTQVATVQAESIEATTTEASWQTIYPKTKPMKIGEVEVLASIAESWPDRIKGLSDTPYLPENVVKVFIFDSAGLHSFWMKDMNYSIDIIWVDEKSEIVHIEEDASPESFPAMFVTKVPAKYVIETVTGFTKVNGISLGDKVVLPTL